MLTPYKNSKKKALIKSFLVGLGVICLLPIYSQNPNNGPNDEILLDNFIKSKGYSYDIQFDASNIKQFWIDPSVLSKDDEINIVLKQTNAETKKSAPLRIQLSNVKETMDCKVDVITEQQDIQFSITNDDQAVLSNSSIETDFINYHVFSSSFHLEDTKNYSFYLIFSTKTESLATIKRIILSFSQNKNSMVFSSPGDLKITENDLSLSPKENISKSQAGLVITGKPTTILTNKFIPVSDNTISVSLKIQNKGKEPARIYVGYATYSKDKKPIDNRHYPFKNLNNVLKVVSISEDSKTITIDSYPEWQKNCFLALDAKADLSDIPNLNLANGRIVEIRKFDNGQAEVVLDTPVKQEIKKGMTVRVHGTGAYLYTSIKVLQTDEEASFNSQTRKDESFLQFSPDTLSKGIYYVKPVIIIAAPFSDNSLLISDYSISF